MQSIRQVQRLNDAELEKCVPPTASWHTDYRDTAFIYIGGLPFELSEGDVLTIFSQFGNPVHINLIRDKETGKSRGFAFLKYEDQRSCDLAVDNLSGAGVMGRVISVDHTRYKLKEGEVEGIGDEQAEDGGADTDREDGARKRRRRTERPSESEEERPMIKEEVELARLMRDHDESDPMKGYLIEEKKAEVAEALKVVQKRTSKEKERHRHRRSRRDEGRREGGDGDGRSRHGHRSRRERREDSVEESRSRHRSHRSRRTRSGTPDGGDGRGERDHRYDREGSDSKSERRKLDGAEGRHAGPLGS